MNRHLPSLFIIGFFLTMTTLLVRDHVIPSYFSGEGIAVSPASIADTWSGKDEWTSVHLNGAPVGAMRNSVRVQEDGYLAQYILHIDTPFLKRRIEAVGTLDTLLRLEQMTVNLIDPSVEDPEVSFNILADGNRLQMKLESESGIKNHTVNLRAPVTLQVTADPFISGYEMQLGETYQLDVYDPLFGMEAGKLRMEAIESEEIKVGQTITIAKVVEARLQNTVMRIWVTPDGEVAKREIKLNGGNTSGNQGSLLSAITLRFDTLFEQEERDKWEILSELPEPVVLNVEDFDGKDEGEPLGGMGVITMLMRETFEKSATETTD